MLIKPDPEFSEQQDYFNSGHEIQNSCNWYLDAVTCKISRDLRLKPAEK